MQRLRSSVLVIACLAASGAALVVQAPDAYAATLLNCSGTATVGFNPGLTNTTQQTTVTDDESYAPCTVPNTGIVSGSGSLTVTVNASCVANVIQVPSSATYTWNTGQTSAVQFGSNEVVRLADGSTQVTSTGSVSRGFGAGAQATRVIVLPQLNAAQCMSPPGVTQLSGPVALTFTGS